MGKRKTARLEMTEILKWAKNVSSIEEALHCKVIIDGPARNITHLKQALKHAYSKNERVEIFMALERNSPQCAVCGSDIPWSRWNFQAWPKAWSLTCSTECGKKAPRTCKDLVSRGLAISEAKKKFFQTPVGKATAQQVGLKNSEKLKLFYQTDYGKALAKNTGKKISAAHIRDLSDGKWAPGIHNRWTRWSAQINEKRFRSSWEACFWFCNQHLEYEVFRCPYWDSTAKKQRIYIGDFWDKQSCTLFEIKPASYIMREHSKIEQVKDWCDTRNINFVLIDENTIGNYLNVHILKQNDDAWRQYVKSKLKS